MGALLAFAFAREQRRRGAAGPVHLFASGRIAPQLTPRRRSLHDLPEAEFRDELARLDGTPSAVLEHDELMGLFSPVIRADLAVNETYRFRDARPLDCPITALGGLDDPWVDRSELDAWRIHTSSTFTVHQLPGKHFFVQTAQPQVLSVVGEALTSRERDG
jgi:medium-chain acyl-[acyl-carrier-protein] hydrolase